MYLCCPPVADRVSAAPDTHRAAVPPVDVRETEDDFLVEIDIPGASREDVELGVERGVLSIRARIPASGTTPSRYHLREHGPRELRRDLTLGDTIDTNGVTAEVSRGVLVIRLPKAVTAKPRRIDIR
jgi:HSP20 family protein